jgi:hypothetical protein
MIGFNKGHEVLSAWYDFVVAYHEMSLAAGEVILRRSLRMVQGSMTGPEAAGMVMEKVSTLATAAERAAIATARGANPLSIATAALQPIHSKTRSNVRKLRR